MAEPGKDAVTAISELAAIVESSHDAIIGKDLNGIVTSWNGGAERIFGFSAGEMIGSPLRRIIPDDRVDEEQRILTCIRRGERVPPFETVRQTKHRGSIHVSVTVSPIRGADGTVVGASKIARDIEDIRERDRAMARVSQRYKTRSLINQAIARTRARDPLLQRICRILVEQHGVNMAWVGWHAPETQRLMPVAAWGDDGYLQEIGVYADERPEGRGPAGKAFREGRAYVVNDVRQDPAIAPWRRALDGHGWRAVAAFPIRVRGKICATLNGYSHVADFFGDLETSLLQETTDDVSFALDNLSRQEDLRHSKDRFRAIFEQAGIGIAIVRVLGSRILECNQSLADMLGYTVAELCAMTVHQVVHPDSREAEAERPIRTDGRLQLERRYRRKNGEVMWGRLTSTIVYDEHGDPQFAVDMVEDITARKRAEAAEDELRDTLEVSVATRTMELQEALHRAEAADRLKSAFLATMSHELRTPMNSIIGFTGIVLQGLAGPLTDEQRKQLGMVRGSAHHLLTLINDILDLSKIEAGQLEVAPEPFDARRMLERAVEVLTPQAEQKGLALALMVRNELGQMVTDQRRLKQIVLNLISNAVKFTERGSVGVSAELVNGFRAAPEAEVGPALRVRVADTGIGIKPESLALLFQPFQQVDSSLTRRHEGTGLGLAICRRLATLLEGEITVESEWEKGSTFTVTVPVRLTPAP